mgnify:CR=1 FL=1
MATAYRNARFFSYAYIRSEFLVIINRCKSCRFAQRTEVGFAAMDFLPFYRPQVLHIDISLRFHNEIQFLLAVNIKENRPVGIVFSTGVLI